MLCRFLVPIHIKMNPRLLEWTETNNQHPKKKYYEKKPNMIARKTDSTNECFAMPMIHFLSTNK
jgi:hypothetical protein